MLQHYIRKYHWKQKPNVSIFEDCLAQRYFEYAQIFNFWNYMYSFGHDKMTYILWDKRKVHMQLKNSNTCN